MQKILKAAAFLLSAALLCPALLACQSGSTKDETPAAETTEKPGPDETQAPVWPDAIVPDQIVREEKIEGSSLYVKKVDGLVEDFIMGDRTMVPLAGPANKQGRIVADNIAGIPSTYKGTQGSSVAQVFDLTAASTGSNGRCWIISPG